MILHGIVYNSIPRHNDSFLQRSIPSLCFSRLHSGAVQSVAVCMYFVAKFQKGKQFNRKFCCSPKLITKHKQFRFVRPLCESLLEILFMSLILNFYKQKSFSSSQKGNLITFLLIKKLVKKRSISDSLQWRKTILNNSITHDIG